MPRSRSIALQPGELFALEHARGAAVVAVAGRLLLTEAGALDDHVLAPAERYTIRGAGRVVLEALGPAAIVVEAPVGRLAALATRFALWQSLWTR